MPPRIALINDHRWIDPKTIDDYVRNILNEDACLARALKRSGVHVSRVAWSDPDVDWSGFDLALIRQTWDYFERFDEFRRWLDHVEGATRVINPVKLIRWNFDKRYLLDLAEAGIDVVATEVVPRGGGAPSLEEWFARTDGESCVIKPAVSGAGRETWRIARTDVTKHDARWRDLVAAEDMLIQPFVPEILSHGEVSLIVIGGEVTHAVRKRARAGEFRVQDDHGGTVATEPVDPSLARAAEHVVAAAPLTPLYARVDLVETVDGPRLMELEVIEPELFFRHNEAAAEQLAAALLDQTS